MCYTHQLPSARRLISLVLWFEVLINLGNGFVSIVRPALALQPLVRESLSNGEHAMALEVSRWFGSMGVAFGGFLLWRVMHIPAALRPVLEALLIGDVLYLGSLVPFALRYGRAPAIIMPYLLTAIMFAARLTYLLCEDWPMLEVSAARRKRRGEKAVA